MFDSSSFLLLIKDFIDETKSGGAPIVRALESQRTGNQNFGKGDIAFQEMVIDTRALAIATEQIQKELGKHQDAITDVKNQFESMQTAYGDAIKKVAAGMTDVAGATFTPGDYLKFTKEEYLPAAKDGQEWPKGVHKHFPSYDIEEK